MGGVLIANKTNFVNSGLSLGLLSGNCRIAVLSGLSGRVRKTGPSGASPLCGSVGGGIRFVRNSIAGHRS